MLNYNVNLLGVILTAIVGQIIGFIWWGQIFGMKWAKLMGMSSSEVKKAKEKSMKVPIIVMLLSNLVMAYTLSILLMATSVTSISAALTIAFWIWLGFIATIGVGVVLWQDKPVSLFWLNSIGWLVTIFAMTITIMMF